MAKKILEFLSFEQVYNFGNYIAVTPPFNFEKYVSKNNSWYKFYVIASGLVACICEVVALRYRSKALSNFRITPRITDLAHELALLVAFLVIKFTATRSWQHLLEHVRHNLYKRSVHKFATIQVILAHLFFLLATLYQWSTFITQSDLVDGTVMASYCIHYTSFYSCVYLTIVMNLILYIFRMQLKTLNKTLNRKPLVTSDILQLAGLYNRICVGVDSFNQQFGHIILFTVLNCTVTAVAMINLMLTSSFFIYDTDSVVISTTLSTLFAASWTVIFIVLCQKVASEAKNIADSCHNLQETVPPKSDERSELEKLARLAQTRPPTITAANFFEINQSTLLGIVSTVTTYVIVLIQLNISENI